MQVNRQPHYFQERNLNTERAYKRLTHARNLSYLTGKHKMADAHGRSVVETNKVNVCVVVEVCVFINVQGIYLL